MNDIYLFRAKRIDNGEWVEGCLLVLDDETYKIATSCLQGKAGHLLEVCAYEVDPSTICQCTGLKDKNGNLIWENDVVDLHNNGFSFCKTEIVSYKDGGFFPFLCFGWECTPEPEYTEVIGNIFDNTELMHE